MPAKTIEEVIGHLEKIIEEAVSNKDPLGIFALVYLGVTCQVRDGIKNNVFENSERMERLDVIFANRYLAAHEAFQASNPCTKAWKSTFENAKRFDLIVLQHMLMGMNAHINLDLGIAAALTVEPADLPSLESDFNKINSILVSKIDEVQDQISKISPLFFLLDWFGKRKDERFAEFSLVKARNNAWKAANRLAHLTPEDNDLEINELDEYVALLNKVISSPGVILGTAIRLIKWCEVKDVGKVLAILKGQNSAV